MRENIETPFGLLSVDISAHQPQLRLHSIMGSDFVSLSNLGFPGMPGRRTGKAFAFCVFIWICLNGLAAHPAAPAKNGLVTRTAAAAGSGLENLVQIWQSDHGSLERY